MYHFNKGGLMEVSVKTPPQNIEAEIILTKTCIYDAINRRRVICSGVHKKFYSEFLRTVIEAVICILCDGERVDPERLREQLRGQDEKGITDILSLEGVPEGFLFGEDNGERIAAVEECHRKRWLASELTVLISNLY
jgi:hypothetical protein